MLKRYWPTFLVCLILIAGMIIMATPIVPPEWQVTGDSWAVILPLVLGLQPIFVDSIPDPTLFFFSITVGGHILFPVSIPSF